MMSKKFFAIISLVILPFLLEARRSPRIRQFDATQEIPVENNPRVPHYPVANIFIDHYEKHAMSGQEMRDVELMSLFESARWAAERSQAWAFVYAKRNSPTWQLFLDIIDPHDVVWAQDAGAFVAIVSDTTAENHAFDAGAAWENLSLAASLEGLVATQIVFDHEEAKKILQLPDNYEVNALVAIGYQAPATVLPTYLQADEIPSDKRTVKEFVFEGTFKK